MKFRHKSTMLMLVIRAKHAKGNLLSLFFASNNLWRLLRGDKSPGIFAILLLLTSKSLSSVSLRISSGSSVSKLFTSRSSFHISTKTFWRDYTPSRLCSCANSTGNVSSKQDFKLRVCIFAAVGEHNTCFNITIEFMSTRKHCPSNLMVLVSSPCVFTYKPQ